MTAMPIDNHPLTQRRLQFIGNSVNKLTLKSINIIQSSNSYNIVSSFISWNQNIVYMRKLTFPQNENNIFYSKTILILKKKRLMLQNFIIPKVSTIKLVTIGYQLRLDDGMIHH